MTTNDDLEAIRTIINAGKTAIVTTQSAEGDLHSRPLALIGDDDEFDGSLWFFTQDPSPKTRDIATHSSVNVSVADNKGYLSLSGTASVDRDQERIDRYWNPYAEAWFENGRDDPSVALLRVDVETAEYWHLDKPAVARIFEVAKGIVTKTPPDVGENHTVSL